MDSESMPDMSNNHATTTRRKKKAADELDYIKPSVKYFGTDINWGPPPNPHFKKGVELQTTGGFDLKLKPLKNLRNRIKAFRQQQMDDLMNQLKSRDGGKPVADFSEGLNENRKVFSQERPPLGEGYMINLLNK